MKTGFNCKTSVKDWVEFCCRSGDLVFDSNEFGAQGRITALQGQRAHRRLQQQRLSDFGKAYQAEVTVKSRVQCEFAPGLTGSLEFQGRIDSVIRAGDEPLIIEEIKTVSDPELFHSDAQTALHMAQAKVYAFAYLQDHRLDEAVVRVCYTAFDSKANTRLVSETTSLAELEQFIEQIARQYLHWQWQQQQHTERRNSALTAMHFPFAEFRPQQRQLSESVYKAIVLKRPLLSEAPTGSGKTLAHLFPGLKAMAQEKIDKLLFVTAKLSGQSTALDSLRMLNPDTAIDAERQSRVATLRCIQIPAKDRSCFCRTQRTNDAMCEFTKGYYDRMPAARDEVLHSGFADKDTLIHIAKKHMLCPFQLVQDCLSWCDVIIADYNYVFDPLVSFKHFLDKHAKQSTLFVDEAHNLAERAREMFSARLTYQDVLALAALSKSIDRALHRSAQQLAKAIKDQASDPAAAETEVKDQPDAGIADKVQAIIEKFTATVLSSNPSLQEHFRALIRYLVISELFGPEHKNILRMERLNNARAKKSKSAYSITLFNTDPADYTRKTFASFHSACLFSASLSPMIYHRDTLGLPADIAMQNIQSPFAPERLKLIVNTAIDTRYKQRENSYQAIAQLLPAIVNSKPGNYIVAFPSYRYLNQVLEHVTPLALTDFDIVTQEDFTTPDEREALLAELRRQSRAKLLFAVTGGSFTEAVDLPGEQLLGIIVIGVGLPQLCTERELIKQRFDINGQGFEYAYQYPGWTRILQSVGRVIRSEADRGIAVLIDSRYAQSRYRGLFPSHWQPQYLQTAEEMTTAVRDFWQNRDSQ